MNILRAKMRSVCFASSTRILEKFPPVLGFVLMVCCAAAQGQTLPPTSSAADAPVASAPPAMEALARARKMVETFFQTSSNVVCTENVTQSLVGKNGKPEYRENSVFDFHLQAGTNSGALKLVEDRVTLKAPFRDASRTLLITNGFTSMLLIVDPAYEASYTFSPAGSESVDGSTLLKFDFKAVPGASSPMALRLQGRSYAVPLSGTIWIDPQSGAVAKIIAATDSSMSDLGLQGMRSEIHYANVQFHDPEESYWMPVTAIIDVETPHQHWRNVHRFTGYKRFKATMYIEGLEKKR